jgi:hypothetical protein
MLTKSFIMLGLRPRHERYPMVLRVRAWSLRTGLDAMRDMTV